MKTAFVAAIGVACAALLMAVSVRAADLPSTFDPARDAARDLESALALAKTQGKRVIVDVGGEWCSWCYVLDRFIAANADVRDTLDAQFVWLKINFSKQNENAGVLRRWPKVAGYPHLFVLDANGVVVLSRTPSSSKAAVPTTSDASSTFSRAPPQRTRAGRPPLTARLDSWARRCECSDQRANRRRASPPP
jgi:hypothetical protein